MVSHFVCRATPALGLIVLLSACSGGGGGALESLNQVPYPEVTTDKFQKFDLAGVGFRINSGTGAIQETTASVKSGQYVSAMSVSDGAVTLSDSDGPTASGIVRDSAQPLAVAQLGRSGGYAYVMPMTMSYYQGGEEFYSLAMVGVQTRAQDMPTSGAALYSGTSRVESMTSDGAYTHPGSRSLVYADFDDGTADVTLVLGPQVDRATGREVDRVISYVQVADMEMDGARFAGGTLVLQNEFLIPIMGSLSSGATLTANGGFFGLDHEAGRPAEVAGHVMAVNEAEEWVVLGSFMAD